jgi:hypothetical protein
MDGIARLDELKLAQIDIFDPSFARDPFATYEAARAAAMC